jgi:predicted phage-related endonuclease
MKILEVTQRTSAWLTARTIYRCASEAPIVMGASRHMSRAELVRMKATGGEKEFSQYVMDQVLAKGKEAESGGILFAETIFDEALFPTTGVDDTNTYLASFDGLTMDETRAVEHKLWNEKIAAKVRAGQVPEEEGWQLEHQALVAGIDEILFVCSDGTLERCVYTFYKSQPERRKQLVAGWDLFEEDVKNYQHVEILPQASIAAPPALPELSVVLVGEVRSTNLATWRDVVAQRIRAIPTVLETDEDFAIAEKTIKFLDEGERKLEFAKSQALAQTASIDELFKTVDSLAEEMRSKRLTLDKLVKARKESVRAAIVQGGRDAFAAHVAALNKRLGRPFMPTVLTDFPGAVKGLRTVQTLRDAVSGELARAKLIANEVADLIQVNIEQFTRAVGDRMHLFPDMPQVVLKPTADMLAIVGQRIAAADEKERKRLDAERELIRLEEATKARTVVVRKGADGMEEAALLLYADEPPPRISVDSVMVQPAAVLTVGGSTMATANSTDLIAISVDRLYSDARALMVRFNRTPTDDELGMILDTLKWTIPA